ncbi:MAG TPA: tetratricopeptide repeat protein [Candidatus Binatia bacterium]|nr:tetratricopeptide repeat protein [Candidatus Binatia bacterium]
MSKDEERAHTAPASVERRLAAILHADVQGYSRLLGTDEVTTLRTVASHLGMMRTLVGQHGGRAVGSRGDSLLAEFPSVVETVQYAMEMQRELQRRNAPVPSAQRVTFRIGINLGEVVVEGEEIYGEGVNIAVRLEGLADAGGICLSEVVYQQLKNKLGLAYEDLGAQALKNIAEPVRVWRVIMDDAAAALAEQTVRRALDSAQDRRARQRPVSAPYRTWVVVAVAVLVLIAGTVVAVRHFSRPPLSPQPSVLSTEAAPAALPLPDKPSLVVLPFDNMSNDPAQDYFSNGITEVLTSDLPRLSSLFVIARNTAFTYQGKPVNIQDVGKELGVRYVLEGSVQKAGEHIRIVTQLIDTTTGGHLWSQRYDRPLQDLFALQDEIVQQIVTTLKLQLTLEEQGYVVRKHTNNLEAYDAFLRGQEYHYRLTKEANIQGRKMFEKAVALDPQYAEAYAWLGYTYWAEWSLRWSADPKTMERALALAQQALALNDSLPTAHSLLSYVYVQKQQYDQAIAEGERAVALDPNDADSYAGQAHVLNFAGRPEEALQMVKQAMRLNPRCPPWYLVYVGLAYRMTGRYAEAIATLKEVISRDPNFIYAHNNLALSYLWQWIAQQSPAAQALEPAVAAGQRALALHDSLHWNHIVLGWIYLYQQQYDQALTEMERAVALAPTEAESYAGLAEVLSYVGRAEDALEAAAQALRLKSNVADAHLYSVGAAYVTAGRPEEAIAPLQRYISRYPNILGAHLTLAAVYSELGQAAEARAEAAEVLRINPKFSLEVHKQRAPIKDPAVLERHIAALHKAGLK